MRMTPPGKVNPIYWRTPEMMPPARPRGMSSHAREIDSI
jgi:hypothetical protein